MDIIGHILREHGDYVVCLLPNGNEIEINKKVFTGKICYGYAFFMNNEGTGLDTILVNNDTPQKRIADKLIENLR